MRNPSEIPSQETRDELNKLSLEEIKQLAFAMLKVNDHLHYHSQIETRQREKVRIKIAQKNIQKWHNKYKE
jgi:hypothetical protein